MEKASTFNNLAPIVLFAYNRPEHTRKTLEALSKNELASNSQLYIYLDGLKNNASQSEIQSHNQVKKVVEQKNWCAHVKIIFRNENFGLADNIVQGVSEIVEKHNRVIVLEDDIVTSPLFLTYMNKALDLYESNKRVMHISGYWFPIKWSQKTPDSFFYPVPSCWGWATWKRAWKMYEPNSKKLHDRIYTNDSFKTFNISHDFEKQLLSNLNGTIKTWAIKWYASVFLNKGLCLHPGVSYVNNIGHDNSGVHSNTTNKYNWDKLNEQLNLKPIPEKLNSKAIRKMRKFYNEKSKLTLLILEFCRKIFHFSLAKGYYKYFSKSEEIPQQAFSPIWNEITNGYGTGKKLYIDVNAFTGWKEMISGKYDLAIFEAIEKEPNISSIYDIGAHFGYNTLIYTSMFPAANIYCFEPNTVNFELLVKHIQKNDVEDKVKAYNFALGLEDTEMSFVQSNDIHGSQSTGSHLISAEKPLDDTHYQGFKEIKVEVRNLDRLIKKEELQPPQILKIDVEGAEFQVLKGVEQTIKKHKPVLLIEIHTVTAMYDCMKFLYNFNYQIELLERENATPSRCFMICK